jgi:hypothetical protein
MTEIGGRKNIFIQAINVPLWEVKDVEKSGFSFAQRQKLLIIGSENKLFSSSSDCWCANRTKKSGENVVGV